MINLHSHTLHSDGCLLPSELAVRYAAKGYKFLAITDHVDYSNIESAISAIMRFVRTWPKDSGIKVLPGLELTHLPLTQFKPLAKFARSKGIKIIIGHGQSPVEPVIPGTNLAALQSDIDILAHPGRITDEEARLAAKRGIFLEVTSRLGHGRANSFVASQALKHKARLVLNHDSHDPEDIISIPQTRQVGLKAGLSAAQVEAIYKDMAGFVRSL